VMTAVPALMALVAELFFNIRVVFLGVLF